MERLLTNVPSLVSQVFPGKPPSKQLYICPCNSIDELTEKIKPTSTYFGLFLAMDARHVDSRKISEAADKALRSGLVYLCAWGPDCERVHDIFDEQDLNRELKKGLERDQDDVVMTTWHDDELLEETLWFFVHSAFPADKYSRDCGDWVVAPVGEPDWEHEIRSKINKIAFGPPTD